MPAAQTARLSRQPGIRAEDLAALHQTHFRFFCGLAYTYLGFADEAEEAVQDSFLRAWSFRDQFRGECSLSSWLGTIVRRQCLETLRRRRARSTAREIPLRRPGEHAEGNPAETGWREPTIDASAFEEVSRADQRAVVLRLAHQLPRVSRAFVVAVLSGEEPDMRRSKNKCAKHRAVEQLRGILLDRTAVIERRNTLFTARAA
jgi:RNA polymerase sigma factor (sigma-70 family)